MQDCELFGSTRAEICLLHYSGHLLWWPDYATLDNERIVDQLIEVEATAKKFTDRNKAKEAQDPEIGKLLDMVRQFLRDKQLVAYGGSALNELQPPQDRFYDYSMEIPDYDVFSPNAQADAIELADRFFRAGYKDAQARDGIHMGTKKGLMAPLLFVPNMSYCLHLFYII